MGFCPNCKKKLDIYSTQCNNCGFKLLPFNKSNIGTYCISCGTKIVKESIFCPTCGSQLKQVVPKVIEEIVEEEIIKNESKKIDEVLSKSNTEIKNEIEESVIVEEENNNAENISYINSNKLSNDSENEQAEENKSSIEKHIETENENKNIIEPDTFVNANIQTVDEETIENEIKADKVIDLKETNKNKKTNNIKRIKVSRLAILLIMLVSIGVVVFVFDAKNDYQTTCNVIRKTQEKTKEEIALEKADKLFAECDYIEALSIYETLENCDEKIKSCNYYLLISNIENGINIKENYEVLMKETNREETNYYLDKLLVNYISSLQVGDYFYYSKSNDEYLVLDVDDDSVLAMCCSDDLHKAYNANQTEITWENCSLRKYLNSDYFNNKFNDAQKELIIERYNENRDNDFYFTLAGNDSYDKVFILSYDEFCKYREIICENNIAMTYKDDGEPWYYIWPLRTPGHQSYTWDDIYNFCGNYNADNLPYYEFAKSKGYRYTKSVMFVIGDIVSSEGNWGDYGIIDWVGNEYNSDWEYYLIRPVISIGKK